MPERGTWVVFGQCYASTAVDPQQKRHGYKLFPEYHVMMVSTSIQEHGLNFQHEERLGCNSESTLPAIERARIKDNNFASYT